MRRTAVSAAFLTALIWCAAPPAADAQISSCTPLGENLYVRDVMTDLYLWYAEMPGADPAAYDSPESYLEAVRFRPLDTTFSYITSRAESDAFFSSSQFVGFPGAPRKRRASHAAIASSRSPAAPSRSSLPPARSTPHLVQRTSASLST
jgi:hypothetical protein